MEPPRKSKPMDRRTFMEMSASVVACGILPPRLALALACGEGNREAQGESSDAPPIVLLDTALAESRAYAELAAARERARIVDIHGDVGALWHGRLGRPRTTLIGTLRASDFFVLRHLAAGEGRIVSSTNSNTSGACRITFRIGAAAGRGPH
jgi:hypothetical protein